MVEEKPVVVEAAEVEKAVPVVEAKPVVEPVAVVEKPAKKSKKSRQPAVVSEPGLTFAPAEPVVAEAPVAPVVAEAPVAPVVEEKPVVVEVVEVEQAAPTSNPDPLLEKIKSQLGKSDRVWITPAGLSGRGPSSNAQRTQPKNSTPDLETDMIPRVSAESGNRNSKSAYPANN